MDKLLFLLTLFTASTALVVAWKQKDEAIKTPCPKCGVEQPIMAKTVNKRVSRGVAEDELYLCKDCRPYRPRKGKLSGYEIWEEYKKDMGL